MMMGCMYLMKNKEQINEILKDEINFDPADPHYAIYILSLSSKAVKCHTLQDGFTFAEAGGEYVIHNIMVNKQVFIETNPEYFL